MKTELYHQLNPLIRLKETELLTPDLFEQLVLAPDVKKVGELLANTVYGKYIQPDFPIEFEQALNQELLSTYEELAAEAPDPRIIWIYTMRYTFHNLKVLTKAEVIKENYDHLFLPDGFYSMEDLKTAIQTGKSAVLPPKVLQSIQEVREYIAESSILQGIDVIYDRRFLKEQRRLGDELNHPELLAEIIAFIDLTNIIIALRCVMQQRSQAFMSSVLSSSGSIPKASFVEFAERDLEQFKQFLLETDYSELIRPAIEPVEIDFALLDLIKDNYLTEMFARSQIQAFGPLPLLAFLNAKDIEVKNLRLIVIGKRSGFTIQQIKERMRQTYDV